MPMKAFLYMHVYMYVYMGQLCAYSSDIHQLGDMP